MLALSSVAAMAPLLALAAITYSSTQRASSSAQWVVHTEEVLANLNLVRADIAEAEAGSQGYARTGDSTDLHRFQDAAIRTNADLDVVRRLTVDNPRQQSALRRVAPLVSAQLAVMRDITNSSRDHGTAGGANAIRPRGQPLSNDIRRGFREITQQEETLLHERLSRAEADTRNTALVRRIAFAVTLAILITTFWFLSRSLTAHKRLEAQRDTFFQVSLDMLCFAGFDGYFKRLNPAWEKTLGYTIEELMSKPHIEFVHPDDREATLRQAAAVAAGASAVSFENRYRCSDGSYKWLLWNSVPMIEQQIIYAVARDLTERKRAEAQLHALSLTDDLTNLRNRRGFLLIAEQELKLVRSKRGQDIGVHLWLIFADVDGLKQINDQLGHHVGSRALVQAADVLTQTFREADVIARLGGDEFAVLALNGDPDSGEQMTARLRVALDGFNAKGDLPYRLSLSLGVVKVDAERVASIEEVLREADQKMYEHKRSAQKGVVHGARERHPGDRSRG